MTGKLFEVLKPMNVVGDLSAGTGGVVAGTGVYVSGNNTVSTMASTKTLFGLACNAASANERVSVIRDGRVRVYNDDTLIAGTFGNMTAGAIVYITAAGLWTHTAGGSGVVNVRVGKVINKTSSYIDVELDIDGATAATA